ncbi:Uncharacterized protein DAT39_000004 [Clarias magur]|uniref:Uncharacterized protein n=1 Tax=Clarias magur TaxID=1594786 RepID=A0A8J4XHC4_CLAMG|nr:Uncharacterized protein DAT39_000004 [Clarias magur]
MLRRLLLPRPQPKDLAERDHHTQLSLVEQRSDGAIAIAACVELHQLACEGSLIDFPLRYLAQWDTNAI